MMQEGNEPIDFTEHVLIPAHDAYRLRGDMAGKHSLIGQLIMYVCMYVCMYVL